MKPNSDYIVYVDESGDHSLESINPCYPIFVLSFCIFEKKYYSHVVTPNLRMLKFSTFGHDMVILHEHDIRKKRGAFINLNKESREIFIDRLSNLIEGSDFILVPIVIDKNAIKKRELDPIHPYHLAMRLGLEKIYQLMKALGQNEKITHIIFEARGQKEDSELEREFKEICNLKTKFPFEILICDKKSNSEGLQFADMVARPIGLSILRPDQPNKAFAAINKKIYQDVNSITYPQKAKDLKVAFEVQAPVG